MSLLQFAPSTSVPDVVKAARTVLHDFIQNPDSHDLEDTYTAVQVLQTWKRDNADELLARVAQRRLARLQPATPVARNKWMQWIMPAILFVALVLVVAVQPEQLIAERVFEWQHPDEGVNFGAIQERIFLNQLRQDMGRPME